MKLNRKRGRCDRLQIMRYQRRLPVERARDLHHRCRLLLFRSVYARFPWILCIGTAEENACRKCYKQDPAGGVVRVKLPVSK